MRNRLALAALLLMGSLVVAAAGGATQLDLLNGWRGASAESPVSAEELKPVVVPRAFQRPASAVERELLATTEIQELVSALTSAPADVPHAYRPGAARPEIRVLLSGLGAGDREIVAFRTIKERLCLGLTGFTSGCFEGLPEGMDVTMTVGDPDRDGMGEGPVIWGYASRNVASLRVVVDGAALPARLGDGAYFFQAPDASSATASMKRLLVEKRDGSVESVELPLLPTLAPPDDPPAGGGPSPLTGG